MLKKIIIEEIEEHLTLKVYPSVGREDFEVVANSIIEKLKSSGIEDRIEKVLDNLIDEVRMGRGYPLQDTVWDILKLIVGDDK